MANFVVSDVELQQINKTDHKRKNPPMTNTTIKKKRKNKKVK